MFVLKVITVFLLVVAIQAEKKIELQDIEEDNLRSEKEKDLDKVDVNVPSNGPITGPGIVPLDFLKNGLLKYFENQPSHIQPSQQQRYIHQYAVTEPPERAGPTAKVQYTPSGGPQQAMVGYLSNIPMQIYLVPQYYGDQQEQSTNPHMNQPSYQSTGLARVAAYPTAPESVQTQSNYVEVPSTGKGYVQQYAAPVAYLSYAAQPTIAPPQATVTPVVAYQVPVVQYTPTVVQTTSAPKIYYQNSHYIDTNTVDDIQEQENDQRQYATQSEVPYHKYVPDYPRHYNSRTPVRDEYRSSHPNTISELPHPNPVLLKNLPPHLAHIPKTLPMYRPLTKPVYQGGNGISSNAYTPRPHEIYGPPSYKRRPSSLLDSYIPSSVQVEYLKRGIIKDPVAIYDALSSGRFPPPVPRQYERGFLPNQMYHTASGGITYGHYKRTPKIEKIPHK